MRHSEQSRAETAAITQPPPGQDVAEPTAPAVPPGADEHPQVELDGGEPVAADRGHDTPEPPD
ncbi:MAG TPA: hypothetical protein VES42_04830 [Pilimelia sp.]|nr:hypothetical protein [Pilimelia sp.]